MSKPEEYSPTDFNPELKNYELGIEYGQQLAEERIIKLLETHAEKELARLRSPSTYLVSEENYAYYEGILEAVSVIKGEQK